MKADWGTIQAWLAWADESNIQYALGLVKTKIAQNELTLLEAQDDVTHTDDADRVILEILSKFDTK